jgi:hypothetical protein
VKAVTDKKKIGMRSNIKFFVKVYNYNHLLPTGDYTTSMSSPSMSSETQLERLDGRSKSNLKRDTRPTRTTGSSRSFSFRCFLIP